MINIRAISSLEKVMPNTKVTDYKAVKELKAAKGERVSFQVTLERFDSNGVIARGESTLTLRSKLSKYITVSRVGYVPSMLPCYPEGMPNRPTDDDYITKEPGLFPDVLFPVKKNETCTLGCITPLTYWITVDLPKDIEAGKYSICFTASTAKKDDSGKCRVVIDVKNVTVEKSDLIFTQWFHCDCIADYFGVKMMSEKHWKLIDAFIKTAARTGITMLLTPLFTPPLDTAVGTERPTMQLIQAEKKGDKFIFDFSLLKRWVDICHKYGIEYFEMSHLFTQWGVSYCPKIIVTVDGKQERMFGWHTASDSPEYYDFLSQLLPQLTKNLEEWGIADKCYFHISDEPKKGDDRPDFENYLKAKTFLKKYLSGYKMMDALSQVDFYDNGLVDYPVCCTNHIAPFMEREIEERWCYYCCSQGNLVANRFFAMPSYRNRVSGVQFYANDISGFLQWGFNFYYSAGATHKIDPYNVSDGNQAWPSGDPYSVYPYENGAIESVRSAVFYEGLQDRMLLKALEKHIGKDKVKELITSAVGEKLTFENHPRTPDFLISLHDKVIDLLEQYGG